MAYDNPLNNVLNSQQNPTNAYYNAANAYNQNSQIKAQSVSEMDQLLNRVNELINGAETLVSKAAGSSGKMLGEMPSPVSSPGFVRLCRPGLIGEIRDRLDVLADNLLHCDGHLSRLNDAI